MAAATAKSLQKHPPTSSTYSSSDLAIPKPNNNSTTKDYKKMSWQQYVDTHIVGTGDATGGLIAGQDGSVWASSPELQGKVTAEEVQNLCKAYRDPSDVQVNGAFLAGQKWRVVKVLPEDGWIHLKKNAESAHVIKTDKTLLVGMNDGSSDRVTEGKTSLCVQKLGDYLKGQGY